MASLFRISINYYFPQLRFYKFLNIPFCWLKTKNTPK